MPDARLPAAPLFRDPGQDGATDPTVVLHRETGHAWMFYTARRAASAGPGDEGVAWVHGTDIGIAVSEDGGAHWRYRGIARGLDFEPGRNTYWAPEVLWHDGLYHMYVTYLRGVRTDWTGPREILHYTSEDLEHWRFRSVLSLSSDRVIDAAVHPLPGGGWRMWFKDEADGSRIHAADSSDLYHWRPRGRAQADGRAQEGPSVVELAGAYWMVTDGWSGLLVSRSRDLDSWTPVPGVLLGTSGVRPGDEGFGHHAMVLPAGEEAVLLYFTHPGDGRRSTVQAAALRVVGDRLACDRDAPFAIDLSPARVPLWRGGRSSR